MVEALARIPTLDNVALARAKLQAYRPRRLHLSHSTLKQLELADQAYLDRE
jgi:hypothetical protein